MGKAKKKFRKTIGFYIAELAVVFIGITAGFMLNNWRQDIDKKELEQKYLFSFYKDVQLDNAELDSLISINQEKNKKLISIIKATEVAGKPLTEKHAEQIVTELLYTQWSTIVDDTFEDIINSGNFNLISNFKLKEKISSYYTFMEDLRSIEQYYKDHMNTYGYPFLYKNYHLLNRKFINKKSITSLEFTNMYLAITALIQQNIHSYKIALNKNIELQEEIKLALQLIK